MTRPDLSILLVEDDDVCAEATVRSLRQRHCRSPVSWVKDGVEALEVLRGQHQAVSIEKPYIVLLDLNMPRMNGFEFLAEVRADAQLRSSVIFVLSTSDSDTDRTRAYHDNIAGYIVKSSIGPQFAKLTQLLSDYGSTVLMPH